MRTRRGMGRALAALLCVLGAGGCSRNEAPSGAAVNEWKFALEEIAGSVQDAYAQEFRRRIEAKSGGAIRVAVYPYGTLGTSDQLTELVENGAIQFAMASPGHLGKVIPATQIFLLHFVFSERNEVNRRVLRRDGELRGRLAPLYRTKGLELLSLYPEGWQVWTTRKPIRRPEDFEGLKIRVMTSPLLLEAYRAYGASPTPLPYSEVYSALQLRMIDAQVNPVFAIEEMSFYEVTDYLVFPRHAQFVTSSITNARFFDGLSADRRGWIEETVAELEGFIFEVQKKLNEDRLETMRAKKPALEIVRLTEEERAAFREASLPVRAKYVELAGAEGADLLETLLRVVRSAEEATAATEHPPAQSSTSG